MIFTNTPETISALKQLRDANKFGEDTANLYPGAPNENVRAMANEVLNTAITRLIEIPDSGVQEDLFWTVLGDAAKEYAKMDSEEMDRAMVYFEQIMDIYGIESSGGRLNNWRYGFQP